MRGRAAGATAGAAFAGGASGTTGAARRFRGLRFLMPAGDNGRCGRVRTRAQAACTGQVSSSPLQLLLRRTGS